MPRRTRTARSRTQFRIAQAAREREVAALQRELRKHQSERSLRALCDDSPAVMDRAATPNRLVDQ